MASRGQGVDLVFDFLTAAEISIIVISSQLNSAVGDGGDGIQSGEAKDFGLAL